MKVKDSLDMCQWGTYIAISYFTDGSSGRGRGSTVFLNFFQFFKTFPLFFKTFPTFLKLVSQICADGSSGRGGGSPPAQEGEQWSVNSCMQPLDQSQSEEKLRRYVWQPSHKPSPPLGSLNRPISPPNIWNRCMIIWCHPCPAQCSKGNIC